MACKLLLLMVLLCTMMPSGGRWCLKNCLGFAARRLILSNVSIRFFYKITYIVHKATIHQLV